MLWIKDKNSFKLLISSLHGIRYNRSYHGWKSYLLQLFLFLHHPNLHQCRCTNPLKLTATNYHSWKLQFHTFLVGYDLLGFIDGTKPCLPAIIIVHNVPNPNPIYNLWVRQHQLLLNAIIGSLSHPLFFSLRLLKLHVILGQLLSILTPKPLVVISCTSKVFSILPWKAPKMLRNICNTSKVLLMN